MTGIESRHLSFRRENRVSQVCVGQEHKIGEGQVGIVSEASISIGNRDRSMVIKKFKDALGHSARENADRAFENYNFAKSAGLRVFPTYRISDDEPSILMTNGNKGSFLCIGTDRDSQLSYRGESKIWLQPDNFATLMDDIFHQAQIATDAGIVFYRDVFFFLLDTESGIVSEIVGDMDNVRRDMEYGYKDRFINNLDCVEQALQGFLASNVSNPMRGPGNYVLQNFNKYHQIRYEKGYGYYDPQGLEPK